MIATSKSEWRWIGPLCGLLAAVGYTATNICLRSVTNIDSAYVAFIRSIPTLLLVLPLLMVRTAQGQSLVAPKTHVFWLVVTGVFTQIFGNVLFQWSLGIIGLALSVPLVFGSMIIGSAVIGAVVLKEPIRKSTSGAIILLLAAVTILTIGAQNGIGPTKLNPQQMGLVTLAVVGNMISGFAYSALGAVMRRGMKAGMSTEMTLLLLSLVGLISLGSWSLVRVGPDYMLQLSSGDYGKMLGAGTLNAVSFYSLATALKRLNVVYVHIINASQAAMAALAGVLIFAEPLTAYLVFGISLTAIGLTLPAYSSLFSAGAKNPSAQNVDSQNVGTRNGGGLDSIANDPPQFPKSPTAPVVIPLGDVLVEESS